MLARNARRSQSSRALSLKSSYSIAALCFVLGFVSFLQFSPRTPALEGALLADTHSFNAPPAQVTPIRRAPKPEGLVASGSTNFADAPGDGNPGGQEDPEAAV
jgi:hypothetical protein